MYSLNVAFCPTLGFHEEHSLNQRALLVSQGCLVLCAKDVPRMEVQISAEHLSEF